MVGGVVIGVAVVSGAAGAAGADVSAFLVASSPPQAASRVAAATTAVRVRRASIRASCHGHRGHGKPEPEVGGDPMSEGVSLRQCRTPSWVTCSSERISSHGCCSPSAVRSLLATAGSGAPTDGSPRHPGGGRAGHPAPRSAHPEPVLCRVGPTCCGVGIGNSGERVILWHRRCV